MKELENIKKSLLRQEADIPSFLSSIVNNKFINVVVYSTVENITKSAGVLFSCKNNKLTLIFLASPFDRNAIYYEDFENIKSDSESVQFDIDIIKILKRDIQAYEEDSPISNEFKQSLLKMADEIKAIADGLD